jgi:hypothetical protein
MPFQASDFCFAHGVDRDSDPSDKGMNKQIEK